MAFDLENTENTENTDIPEFIPKQNSNLSEKQLLSHISKQIEILQKQNNQLIKIEIFKLKLQYPDIKINNIENTDEDNK